MTWLLTGEQVPSAPAPVIQVGATGTTSFNLQAVTKVAGFFSDSTGLDFDWGDPQLGASLEYTVNVAQAGNYQLGIYYSAEYSGADANIQVNGSQQGSVSLASTQSSLTPTYYQSFDVYRDSPLMTISLAAGLSTLTLAAVPGSTPFNIGGISLTPSGLSAPAPYAGVTLSLTGSVTLNGGGAYTNQSPVLLNLSSAGATQVWITPTAGCATGGSGRWFTYAPSISFASDPELSQTNGSDTVYVQFTNGAGALSPCYSATTYLDTVAPTGSIAPSGTATLTASPSFTWTASDSGSGVQSVQYAIGTGTSGASESSVLPWATAPSGTVAPTGLSLSKATVYYINLWITDNAGNVDYISSSPWTIPLQVQAVYANGSNWNDYVKNDGASLYTASDTACTGSETPNYNACLHGGELREVSIDGAPSCTGLSLTDSLGVFSWSCVDTSGTPIFYSALQTGKGLGDLVDSSSWKSNSVTLVNNGATISSTPLAAWWANPVVSAPSSAASMIQLSSTSGSPGTIYTISGASTGMGYNLSSSKTGLVVLSGGSYGAAPGFVSNCSTTSGSGPGLPGTGGSCLLAAGTASFLWVEGTFSASGGGGAMDYGLLLGDVTFSQGNLLTIQGGAMDGIHLISSPNNRFSNATSSTNVENGVFLDGASGGNSVYSLTVSGNYLSLGSNIGNGLTVYSANNSFQTVTVSNNGDVGIYIGTTTGTGNLFTNVVTSGNYLDGMELDVGANGNSLIGVTAIGNGQGGGNTAGVHILSDSNTLSSLQSADNGVDGVSLDCGASCATGNKLAQVRAADNGANGVALVSGAVTNSFNQVTVYNNGNDGVLVASNGNDFADVVAISNDTGGGNGSFGSGIEVNGGSQNIFSGVTAIFNGMGVTVTSSTYNVFHQVIASLSRVGGISISASTDNTFSQIVVTDSPSYPVSIAGASSPNQFAGQLLYSGNCAITSSSAGLANGAGGSGCATTSTSGATLAGAISVVGSLIGPIGTSDPNNASDGGSGTAVFPSVPSTFDWLNFSNSFRGWGVDPGRWTSGTGSIMDAEIRATDTVLLNRIGAFPASSGAPCPANASEALTTEGTTPVTYLANAVEDLNSGNPSNNGDGLCESGETCIYTPDFGAYQGGGSFGTCGFTNGTVTGVTMEGYSSNGI